jgi:hypothetical protein
MTTDRIDPHILEPGRAPTPFTAVEIRRGCPAGRTIRLLVESEDIEPLLRINQFVECDERGATIERTRFTTDGEPLGPPEADRTTWAQLQAHASFPADQTSILPETSETPLGVLECLRYTVTDGSTVQTFWFAKETPGMPVRSKTQTAGRVTSTVTMMDNASP